MADCVHIGATTGNLCGICPDCDRYIYRRVNLAKIDTARGDLDITFTEPSARIGESQAPSVNCDFRRAVRDNENP